MARPTYTPEERIARFLLLVDKTPTCWLWKGASNGRYGSWKGLNYEHHTAHKWSYIYFVGPVPSGMDVDHKCETSLCVNPEHLQLLLPSYNRAWQSEKEHCKRGHPLKNDNLYITPDGRRQCKDCIRRRNEKASERRITISLPSELT